MQDVCHTNFVIDLAHGGVCGSVIEDRSAESEGPRFDSSWGLSIFLCPSLVTRRKTFLSIVTTKSYVGKSVCNAKFDEMLSKIVISHRD